MRTPPRRRGLSVTAKPKDGIAAQRIRVLNDRDYSDGRYVLYWMQQSQRGECNHALEYAALQANRLGKPLVAVFGLTDDYPEANLRHYTFMLEGLQETQWTLGARGIPLSVVHGPPPDVALRAAREACLLICDRGYLTHQKRWREVVAAQAECRVEQVESDVIVPVEAVSDKQEYAARTIRPKIHRLLSTYLVPLRTVALRETGARPRVAELDLRDLDAVLRRMKIDRSVPPVTRYFRGGTSQAKRRYRAFLRAGLTKYQESRAAVQTADTSHTSMYLHFGQVSPLYLALEALQSAPAGENRDAFLEQLIVRRELAMNYANFSENYDSFGALPAWARETLQRHQHDPRTHQYSTAQLEVAATHDRYWNAAMDELKITGYMHNYMRMYWSKKILEWSATPQAAFKATLALMNRYFLDARDPNGYTNVAGTLGLHDRAWPERPIFGKIRYMSASGLERKSDIAAYVAHVERLRRTVERSH